MAQCEATQASETPLDTWQAASAAGAALLTPDFADLEGVNWPALREHVANTFNAFGNAHGHAEHHAEALVAFERACAVQPEQAMWQRNRAGTLIALGRLDEAEAVIAQARVLEPDAPRLESLTTDLAQARAAQTSSG